MNHKHSPANIPEAGKKVSERKRMEQILNTYANKHSLFIVPVKCLHLFSICSFNVSMIYIVCLSVRSLVWLFIIGLFPVWGIAVLI